MMMRYELVMEMRYGNMIVEFWGDTIIYTKTRNGIIQLHLKIWGVCKMFSLSNHKMIATNTGQYIAQVLTDETIDSAGTKKGTGVASPS